MDCLHSLNSHCTVHGMIGSSTLTKSMVHAIKSCNTSSFVHSLYLGSSVEESRNLRQTAAGYRQNLFNRIASNYDHLNDLLSLGQHRIWKRMAVSWSGAKAGDNVLDICCGSGDLTFLLAEKVGVRGKDWILDNVVVPVANGYGLGDDYAYLKTSIANFPTGKQQEKLALEVGFSRARHYGIAGGLMGVLVATH